MIRDPRIVAALAIALALALSVLAEVYLVDNRKYLFAGSDRLLFWTAFGLVNCLGIVLVSKWIGHAFLMRHDDPYSGEHVQAEPEEQGDG